MCIAGERGYAASPGRTHSSACAASRKPQAGNFAQSWGSICSLAQPARGGPAFITILVTMPLSGCLVQICMGWRTRSRHGFRSSPEDRAYMHSCRDVVVASAIFGKMLVCCCAPSLASLGGTPPPVRPLLNHGWPILLGDQDATSC